MPIINALKYIYQFAGEQKYAYKNKKDVPCHIKLCSPEVHICGLYSFEHKN